MMTHLWLGALAAAALTAAPAPASEDACLQGRLHLHGGRYEPARVALKQCIASTRAPAMKASATKFLGAAEALAAAADEPARRKAGFEYHLLLAGEALSLGEAEQAATHAADALAIDSRQGGGWVVLSEALFRTGAIEQAGAAVRQAASRLDGAAREAVVARLIVIDRMREGARLARSAAELSRRGHAERAGWCYRQAYLALPSDSGLAIAGAAAFAQAGVLEPARVLLDLAAADDAPAIKDEVRELRARAPQLSPGPAAPVAEQLRTGLLALGAQMDALKLLEAAARRAPACGLCALALAEAQWAAQKPGEAEASARAAIASSPADPYAHVALARALLERNALEAARKELAAAGGAEPTLGLHRTIARLETAAKSPAQVLARTPADSADAAVQQLRAQAALATGDVAAAVLAAARAEVLAPFSPDVLLTRAATLFKKGEIEAGKAASARAAGLTGCCKASSETLGALP